MLLNVPEFLERPICVESATSQDIASLETFHCDAQESRKYGKLPDNKSYKLANWWPSCL